MTSKHTRPRWVALAAAAACVLGAPACGGSGHSATPPTHPPATHPPSTAAVAHPTSLDTGFERGTAAGLTDHAHARVTRDAARNGSFGFDVAASGSDAYGRWDARAGGTDHSWWSFRAWVRIVSWTPGESVDLFTVRNLGVKNNFDLFVGAPGSSFQWDLFRENSAVAPGPVALGRWYLVEARGSFASGTSTADVRIDGVAQPSIASPGQPPSAVKDFVLGSVGTTKTNRVQFDDMSVEVGDGPLPLLGPPASTP